LKENEGKEKRLDKSFSSVEVTLLRPPIVNKLREDYFLEGEEKERDGDDGQIKVFNSEMYLNKIIYMLPRTFNEFILRIPRSGLDFS
jgi:hypothetical protein